MKRLLPPSAILLILLFGTPALADFTKGFEAYKSRDYATSLREWRPLAEQGHRVSQYNLGLMYDNGYGVTKDYKTAVKWYALAAKKGYVNAQNNLGVMYKNGIGVPLDYDEAIKWFTLAAKQGSALTKENLRKTYEKRDSIKKG